MSRGHWPRLRSSLPEKFGRLKRRLCVPGLALGVFFSLASVLQKLVLPHCRPRDGKGAVFVSCRVTKKKRPARQEMSIPILEKETPNQMDERVLNWTKTKRF